MLGKRVGCVGTWLPRVSQPGLFPFRSFLPFPVRISGQGEGERRCEGHLPLPPSRTLTKGGHGRTLVHARLRTLPRGRGFTGMKKDARRRVLMFHAPPKPATSVSCRTKDYFRNRGIMPILSAPSEKIPSQIDKNTEPEGSRRKV